MQLIRCSILNGRSVNLTRLAGEITHNKTQHKSANLQTLKLRVIRSLKSAFAIYNANHSLLFRRDVRVSQTRVRCICKLNNEPVNCIQFDMHILSLTRRNVREKKHFVDVKINTCKGWLMATTCSLYPRMETKVHKCLASKVALPNHTYSLIE